MAGKLRLAAMAQPFPQPRPQAVCANEREPALLLRPVPRHYRHCDAVFVSGEVLNSPAEMEADVGIIADRRTERGLQVAAVNHPVWCAITLLNAVAERRARKLAPSPCIHYAKLVRRDHVGLQMRLKPEPDQNARSIGR